MLNFNIELIVCKSNLVAITNCAGYMWGYPLVINERTMSRTNIGYLPNASSLVPTDCGMLSRHSATRQQVVSKLR